MSFFFKFTINNFDTLFRADNHRLFFFSTIVNTSNITVEPDIGIVLLGKKLV